MFTTWLMFTLLLVSSTAISHAVLFLISLLGKYRNNSLLFTCFLGAVVGSALIVLIGFYNPLAAFFGLLLAGFYNFIVS